MITIVIPCLNSARFLPSFRECFEGLGEDHEVVVVDSSSDDGTAEIARSFGWTTISIRRDDFDHGGSRNLGFKIARGDVVVMLSHDVRPAKDAIALLVRALRTSELACVYGRQVASNGASLAEKCLRQTNYQERSYTFTLDDIKRNGLGTAFFSDAFAAYRVEDFVKIGGFSAGLILGEDTEICMRFLLAGAKVGYSAEAVVLHTHNYNLTQEFRRSFDIGVFHRQRGELIGRFGGVGGKGLVYLRLIITKAIQTRRFDYLVKGPLLVAIRAFAFITGKKFLWAVPRNLRAALSYNRRFWVLHD